MNTQTERLYQKDVYMTQFESPVIAADYKANALCLMLERSCFFPEGGGQSSDTGFLTIGENTYTVTHVYEDDHGQVWHVTDTPEGDVQQLQDLAGLNAYGTIDWDHRFENMQRHLGEHILSGRFDALFGGVNRGFHMGEDYMTIDIKPEKNPAFTEITYDMALQAEADANRVIWADLPVRVFYFSTFEEANEMPLRKELAFDEDISVVTVGDPDVPADCVACCGTHPDSTGQVGLVKVYRVEKNRDMWRIYFDAGSKAVAYLSKVYDGAVRAGREYSAAPEELETKLAADRAKNEEIKQKLITMRNAQVNKVLFAAIGEAEFDLKAGVTTPTTVTVTGLSLEDFSHAGKLMEERLWGTVILRFPEESSVMLFSDGDYSCGAAVKENIKDFDGKGGGSDIMARAIFPDNRSMDAFLERLGASKDLML